MARQLHKLNVLQVARLSKKGRHGDGGGLYLSIDSGDRKRWVFLFRDRRSGKLREMGLGPAASVTLADARAKAAAARALLKDGKDPFVEAKSERTTIPTFGEVADQFMAAMASQWRNAKHRAQWTMTLQEYAKPLRNMPVDQIGVADVLAVLKPHWERRPETAGRLRGRIERVLNAAKAQGYRTGENPAAWRGHLENLLPIRQKLSRGHHEALPWQDMPAFMADLRQRQGVAALALEFLILCAARSGEVRGAPWEEFDLGRKIWIIPAARMKAQREHRVPLVPRASEILETVAKLPRDAFVFSGQRHKSPLSDMSLTAVLKRMKVEVTAHGFRSSFKDWASEATSFPNELSEAALAHITGDKVERAYRRGDVLDRRRKLMDAWAQYLDGESNVVTIKRPA
jgi:integrase